MDQYTIAYVCLSVCLSVCLTSCQMNVLMLVVGILLKIDCWTLGKPMASLSTGHLELVIWDGNLLHIMYP